MLRLVTVPVLRQHRGNFALRILFSKQFWMRDVVVVGDATIFRCFMLVGRGHQVHLIFVATIRTVQRATEVRLALVLVVATGIVVIQIESKAQLFVGIYGKLRIDMVLTVLLVTTVVVANVGIWRQRVQKVEVLWLFTHIIVAVNEVELAVWLAVNEDTAQSRRIVVTQ